MNTRDAYIKWIEDKILEHQTQIARLTVALQVLEEMPGRRLEGMVEREKKPRKSFKMPPRAEVVRRNEWILAKLREAGQPAKASDLFDSMGIAKGHVNRKSYYNALSRMKISGEIVSTAPGVYALPREAPDTVEQA